jgi:uncharacterized protein (TIGR00369 family)
MIDAYLSAVRQESQTVNRLFGYLGIRVVEITPVHAVLALPFREEFLQGASSLAGGIQAALMDEAMAHAVLAGLEPDRQTVTMDLHMRYLRPAGRSSLRAEARIVRRGGRVVVVEGEIQNDAGEAVSLATASFLIIRPEAKQPKE